MSAIRRSVDLIPRLAERIEEANKECKEEAMNSTESAVRDRGSILSLRVQMCVCNSPRPALDLSLFLFNLPGLTGS